MDEARSRNKKLHELVEKTFSVALRYARACGSKEVLFFNHPGGTTEVVP